MADLDDVRRRFPVADRAAYAAAYAEADLAGRLGEALHRARIRAGLGAGELGERLGMSAEAVELAEEGGADLSVGFFDRLGRALGMPVTLALAGEGIDLGDRGDGRGHGGPAED